MIQFARAAASKAILLALISVVGCQPEKATKQSSAAVSRLTTTAAATTNTVDSFRRAYAEAKTPDERRAIGLKVMDAGLLEECQVTDLDSIFGTKWHRPFSTSAHEGFVDFATPLGEKAQDGSDDWCLVFGYQDDLGIVTSFWITNRRNWAPASGPAINQKLTIDEIRGAYKAAATPESRRKICIKAIDAGIIGPGTHLSDMERIFGFEWRNNLARPDRIPIGWVDFGASVDAFTGRHTVVDLSFEYNSDGVITAWWFTNMHFNIVDGDLVRTAHP